MFLTLALALGFLLSSPIAKAQDSPTNLDFTTLVFEADRAERHAEDGRLFLNGQVVLDDGQRLLIADSLILDPVQQTARARGQVSFDLGDGQVIHASDLTLDQRATEILFSNVAVRLRDQALLAAASAKVTEQSISLSRAAYTACEAPCDLSAIQARNTLPWELQARSVTLDQKQDVLIVQGIKLRIFDFPVASFPLAVVPAPYVERKSGFLGLEGREGSDDQGWTIGIPLYVTLGPSSDTTLTPQFSEKGDIALKTEFRLRQKDITAESLGIVKSDADFGLSTSGVLALSSNLDLIFDWAGESQPGLLSDQGLVPEDLHSNRLSLERLQGHSFSSLGVHQDAVLNASADWQAVDLETEAWVPRLNFDHRLPPLKNGGRFRLQGDMYVFPDQALAETSLNFQAPLMTEAGLKLSPQFEGGLMGRDSDEALGGWFGGQLKASLPLSRSGQFSSSSLIPTIALTGVAGRGLKHLPLSSEQPFGSAGIFDLRRQEGLFEAENDLRLDGKLDYSLYPSDDRALLGLRTSVGQSFDLTTRELSETLIETVVDLGSFQLEHRAAVDVPSLAESPTNKPSIPRLALDASVPITPWFQVSGSHRRLNTALDFHRSNSLSLDLNLKKDLDLFLGLDSVLSLNEDSQLDLRAGLKWEFETDWLVEAKIRQDVFDGQDQDLSFDLYYDCNCLGLQLGVLRETRPTQPTEYQARFALDLPTLFEASLAPRFWPLNR